MVVLTPSGIVPVELVEAVDKIRTIPPEGEIVRVGRNWGSASAASEPSLHLNPSEPDSFLLLNSVQRAGIGWVAPADPGQVDRRCCIQGIPVC